jgi:hypothetical protein
MTSTESAPRGDRATKLFDAFDKALGKWTQAFSFEQFAACFPSLLDNKKAQAVDVLHPLYVALVSRFIENATVIITICETHTAPRDPNLTVTEKKNENCSKSFQ